MDEFQTYYELLQIDESAPTPDIKKAYRRLSTQYHPDKLGHIPDHLTEVKKDAEEKYRQIQDAYDVLRDDDKRRKYDEQLKLLRTQTYQKSHKPTPPPPPPQTPTHPQPKYTPANTAGSKKSTIIVFISKAVWLLIKITILGFTKLWSKPQLRKPLIAVFVALLASGVATFFFLQTKLVVKLEYNGSTLSNKETREDVRLLIDSKPFQSEQHITPFVKTLKIESDKFNPISLPLTNLKLRPGKTNETPIIKLTRSTGTININISPASASYVITDSQGKIIYGRGNNTYKNIPTGDYTVTWKHEHWTSDPTKIKVSRGETTRNFAFDASLIVNSEPAADTITINGKNIGSAPFETQYALPGNTKITLSKKGFYEESFDVTLKEGETSNINLKLEPIYGEKEIQATPATGETSTLPKKILMGRPKPMIKRVSNAFQHAPIRINIKPDGLTLTFLIKNITENDDIVFGYETHQKGLLGSEGIHILDDSGTKLYPTRYYYSNKTKIFDRLSQHFTALGSYNTFGCILSPKEQIEFMIDFPPIPPGASTIEFVSPKVYIMQERWAWSGIKIFRKSLSPVKSPPPAENNKLGLGW